MHDGSQGAFTGLAVHPDVPAGVRQLAELGIRLVALSSGSASIAQRLLSDAGLGDAFEGFLSSGQQAGRRDSHGRSRAREPMF
ncbi:HAD family hydrolase [Promicromonospora iranensis]|uniref:FMN phosphatase YigB (HAD superfamily) n=1 Tax=Promicromonospora iranensis TaxID=1105144 RepID=A0ABU2CGP6_9MICO|nr:HAD family hydrolase [Promicromonospora iranensis]MDR7380513.1 FMN phosphatase YigB (HAD superfamily) [Promicromonospora iranensis]